MKTGPKRIPQTLLNLKFIYRLNLNRSHKYMNNEKVTLRRNDPERGPSGEWSCDIFFDYYFRSQLNRFAKSRANNHKFGIFKSEIIML